MKVLAINCTLKNEQEESSTRLLLSQVLDEFKKHEVSAELLHAKSFNIKEGVTSDEGQGDQWPLIREKLLSSDIFILGTPIWLGQPSSICKKILERLDAFLSETDDQGRMLTYGKVAGLVVLGNEDGAHHVSAEIYQALNDVGFSLAPNAVSYWVGEAMQGTDYKDLSKIPEKVQTTIKALAKNSIHLSGLIKEFPYPSQN